MTFFQKIQKQDNTGKRENIKTLPNSFSQDDSSISLGKAVIISIILHPIVVLCIWISVTLLTLMGLIPDFFDKPSLKNQDIEFVLVDKPEEPPINKDTPYRADRNSRAGGKHDPKKKVVEPSPAPAPAGPKKKTVSSAPAPAPQKTVKKATGGGSQAPKTVQKNIAQTQAPTRPTKAAPPRPGVPAVGKPTGQLPKAQMPKLAAKPTSPFSVGVTPNSSLPKGPVYSTTNGTSKYGGGGVPNGTGTSRRSAMPAPQFSTGKGTGTGVGTGTGSGSGSGSGSGGTGGSGKGGNGIGGYGTGGMGNPGPGNPNGRPGIDAVKSPDWGPYMRELERRIKRNWNPPKGNESKRVVMLFTIGRDGRLMSISTVKSSGSSESDLAAKKAIELTAPFKSLPPEFKGSKIDIEFTFDYNVLNVRSYR